MKKIILNERSNVVDEHFWFTAITLAFNSFIIEKLKDETNNVFIITSAIVVNLYALFLILHRAAEHAGRLKYPKWLEHIPENEKLFYHKALETLINVWLTIKMVPIIICEFSGAFFYFLLILSSFLAIFMKI